MIIAKPYRILLLVRGVVARNLIEEFSSLCPNPETPSDGVSGF
jgi:hypothetical protein